MIRQRTRAYCRRETEGEASLAAERQRSLRHPRHPVRLCFRRQSSPDHHWSVLLSHDNRHRLDGRRWSDGNALHPLRHDDEAQWLCSSATTSESGGIVGHQHRGGFLLFESFTATEGHRRLSTSITSRRSIPSGMMITITEWSPPGSLVPSIAQWFEWLLGLTEYRRSCSNQHLQ